MLFRQWGGRQPWKATLRYRLKHIAEYVTMRGASAVLGHLPYRLALGIGWVAALILWCVLPRLMREARRRLRSVLVEKVGATTAARGATWRAWRNLVFSGVDARIRPWTVRPMGSA